MFHTTKYGSEDLLGMNTKVSTVNGTTGEKVQTVEALADSGAAASIISWDLAKKVNMIVLDKGDATLKDASHKHIDAIQSKQGWQQLREETPDSQGNESIQAITSGGRPAEEDIQSRQERQQLKEKPPDSKGNKFIEAIVYGCRNFLLIFLCPYCTQKNVEIKLEI